ncbi:MAG: ABC transporter substrate-binding protein [Clostridia bacterium]|nr:ABC transporter substrate-binding protein [Clostridia bacterium]
MKKITVVALIVVLTLAVALTCCFAACEKADFTIGIIQLAPHTALDKANEGFRNELDKLMQEAGLSVKYKNKNANGDDNNNSTIVGTFMKTDLIYSIATSSSQAAKIKATEKNIPVIFNAVTDPKDAGLVNDWNVPGVNVTGVSDKSPMAQQADLMEELLGGVTPVVGILFTSKENNSIVQKNEMRAICEAKGWTVVEKGIQDINEIQDGLTSMTEANIIYIPTDNTLAESAATVHSANVNSGYKRPIVCGEEGMNDLCGVATYGVDYYELGKMAAHMAFDILVNGKSAAEMPVMTQQNGTLSIRTDIAAAIGFTIPQSILDRAAAQ